MYNTFILFWVFSMLLLNGGTPQEHTFECDKFAEWFWQRLQHIRLSSYTTDCFRRLALLYL